MRPLGFPKWDLFLLYSLMGAHVGQSLGPWNCPVSWQVTVYEFCGFSNWLFVASRCL